VVGIPALQLCVPDDSDGRRDSVSSIAIHGDFMKRNHNLLLLVLGLSLLGCSKSGEPTGGASPSRSASGQAASSGKGTGLTAKETAGGGSASGNASGQVASPSRGTALTAKGAEERLVAAGWKIESNQAGEQDWSSHYLKIQKGEDDAFRSAKVWVDALGESSAPGAPKPVLTLGNRALIRFGWAPSADKKPAPDLARFAKDVAEITSPDRATDELFNHPKFSQAVTKWGLREDGGRSGGRVSPSDVVYNHRFLEGDTGTLAIEVVFFAKAIEKGDARMIGTTLIAVEADDDATRKALFELLTTS
jgi:hypothetical protein